MDILILAHFTTMPKENGNNRFNYLADLLACNMEHNEVEIVTSSFSHTSKKQRDNSDNDYGNVKYKIHTCYEPGYPKNVCVKRFYSHYVFGKNLRKYLESRKIPDVIYCAVPSLDAAYVAMRYAKREKIKFIIDIQDLWPEAFQMVFNVPLLSTVIFQPMKSIVNKVYAYADEIVAVSDTYCKRAKQINDKVRDTHTVFLGTELKQFDDFVARFSVERNNNEIWLAYCGTLGHSYDLKCVIDAMEILVKKGVSNIKFVVMGDGPLRDEFENYARNKNVSVEFTGRLEYGRMCGLLASCDIAMNVISHGAAQSIINKHADYAAAGIPVISTQENEEYRNLVEEYQMGYNCPNGDSAMLAENILGLVCSEEQRKEFGRNARKCAEERFDRQKTYSEIISIM